MWTQRIVQANRGMIVLAILAILAPTPRLACGGEINFKPGWNLFSPKQDVEVGRENAKQVEKQLPILRDAEVERYVNTLGRRLSSYAPNNRDDYAWQFKVVNTKDINAFALPGGFIYVNRGTIEAAQDEAQLAGVMAHEEGHVVMRHGTHQASQAMLAQAPLALLGGVLSQSGGLMEQLAQMGIGLGVQSVFLHYSRGMESQADQVGTYILYHAGYDPYAMAQFFEILEKKYPQGGGAVGQFFSDHPNPGNRIKNVDAEIPELGPAHQGKADSAEFQAVKKRVLGLPAPPKGRSAPQMGGGDPGRSRAEMRPSPNFRTFDHRAFRIDYPDNWQVMGDHSAVTIAPAGGISANAVAYGVIIDTFQPEQGRDSTLDAATNQLVEVLRQSKPDLRVVRQKEDFTVDREPAQSVELAGPSPILREGGGSQRERDWLVAVPRHDGTLLYLVFISPEDDFRQLRAAFEDMLRSFRLRRA